MNRIFITGDTHGKFNKIETFCKMVDTSEEDIMIILGDVGLNYYCDNYDIERKNKLSRLPLTFLCVHGNHEERAWNINTYHRKTINQHDIHCDVWVEDEYPNIWFLDDISQFKLLDKTFLAISGAYSIDKEWRLLCWHHWFPSEQIDPSTMQKFLDYLKQHEKQKFDYVLSHTCPFSQIPTESFLPNIDQSKVDKRTELFLEDVMNQIDFNNWMCGHFHIDKFYDKFTFLFNDIMQLDCEK